MEKNPPSILSRREFIRQAACAAVGTTALTATIRDLRFMNAAVAQSNINDYKALVCIFMAGGNDSNNLIVPTILSEYNNYAAIRTPILALPLSGSPNNILPISPLNSDGHEYGLHPASPELVTLFGEGKLAVLFNTGTLAFPITRAQYQSGSIKKPPQLFSHADQVTQWQTSIPDQPPTTGWGGRCADLLAAVQPGAPISLSVTLSGANTFEVGNSIAQYSVSTGGAIQLTGVSGSRLSALTNILGVPYSNMQAQAYAGVAAHAINTSALLNNSINDVTNGTLDPSGTQQYWTTPFPGSSPFQVTTPTSGTKFNSSLGPQLKMIARLIQAGHRSTLTGGFGMKRQIFFCSVGGYDLHTGQTTVVSGVPDPTKGSHANLFAELSQCMYAFQRAMEQLGLSNNVTAFTSSDFGRTFPSNGQGSDHGWGSHHLIVGGAVKGQQTYGRFPTLAVNGPDDTSTGRWIPTIACDQYFATLATWFGVDTSNLTTVFPNLGRFATANLGFI
jgi:uncharacterized protein (DUF1501 family)